MTKQERTFFFVSCRFSNLLASYKKARIPKLQEKGARLHESVEVLEELEAIDVDPELMRVRFRLLDQPGQAMIT